MEFFVRYAFILSVRSIVMKLIVFIAYFAKMEYLYQKGFRNKHYHVSLADKMRSVEFFYLLLDIIQYNYSMREK